MALQKQTDRPCPDNNVSPSGANVTVRPEIVSKKVKAIRTFLRSKRPVSGVFERLLQTVAPLFEQINSEIARIGELRNTPAGNIRITCSDDAAESLLRPALPAFFANYPDISVAIYIDYGFTNIVTERFDAGIRLGEAIGRDMIAVRLGPDWRLAVVGTPAYFQSHPVPVIPQDLTAHRCINIRHSVGGSVYAWEFEKAGRKLNIRVNGPLLSNSIIHVMNGALDSIGLACVPEHMARPHIEAGRLIEVLADWSQMFEGFHLYYPNRRNTSSAFAAFVEAVRYRG